MRRGPGRLKKIPRYKRNRGFDHCSFSKVGVPPPTTTPTSFNLPGNFFNKSIENRRIWKEKVLPIRFTPISYPAYSTFSHEGSGRTGYPAVGGDPQGRKHLPLCGQYLADWKLEVSDNIGRYIQKYRILLERKSKNIH